MSVRPRRRVFSRLRLYSLAPLLMMSMVDCGWVNPFEDCAADIITSPVPTWAAGPEASVLGSDFGAGIRARYIPANSTIGIEGSFSKYFPDAGSAYGASLGARLSVPSGGALRPYGFVGGTLLRTGYGGYEFDESEFDGLGGGAFRQDFGSDSQTAYGLRFGIGASGGNPESRWSPFGEVGYNLYVAGAEFDNKATVSGGVTYRLGGGS